MPIQSPALNKLVISSGNMDLRYTYVPSFFGICNYTCMPITVIAYKECNLS